MLALAMGCGGKPSTTADRPIEMLVLTDPETLDPRYATDAVALRSSRLLHAGLVRLDPDTLEPKPGAARAWEWVDDRTLRVELRDDVRFHSGKKLAPEDVVATLHAFAAPEVGSRHARVVEPIESTTIVSPSAVLVHLKRAHATLLTDLEVPILRADEAMSAPRPDGSLDGIGPYVVARNEHGAIVLDPAKDGVLPTPHRSVVLRTVHDENARALRMQAGRADVVVNGFSPTLLPSFDGVSGVAVTARRGANLTYLLTRNDRGWLALPNIRRALSACIDREKIAKTLYAGRAQAATTLIPPGHWAYSPLPEEKVAATGEHQLHFTLLTSTDRFRGTVARVLSQELAECGFTIDVVPLELGTLLARLASGDFELATLQLPEITEPNVLRFFLHSEAIPPAGANRGRIRDADVDRLLDEGASSIDIEKRKAIYRDLERIVRERALFIPLWHEDQIAVTSSRASTFRPSAEGRWLDLATLR